MQDLLELIRSININRMKSSGLWPLVFEGSPLMEKLCDAIYQGVVITDEDAMALLYPGGSGRSKLLNLRERLREKLLSVVFLLEFRADTCSVRQKAYQDCNQKWAAAMLLNSKNIKGAGISLLEEVLKESIYYEFTDLVLNTLSPLRVYYGTIQGDLSKYQHYKELYHKYQEAWLIENEAEDAYTELVSYYVKSRSSKPEISQKAAEYLQRFKPYMARSDSFKLHLCGRLVEVMALSGQHDYQAIAKVCEDAVVFFQKKPFESYLPLQAFYYQLILCYIHLRDFEKGEAIIMRYQSVFEEGSFNWFKLQELFFLLSMYTKRYDRAFLVSTMVQKRLASGSHAAQIVEIWKIYEAYIQFFIQIGEVTPPAGYISKFKVTRFLNEIPTFSKDKQGMNIPVLIIQILFDIADRHYKQSIDRMEAIEKYCSRYLKQNDTYRSSCFIKALLQFPTGNFHPEAVHRKAKKYIDLLHAQPANASYQTYEIEIVPYEQLWELALRSLGSGKARSVAR